MQPIPMHCKNCGKALNEHHNYCNYCGAKVIRNRLSPKILLQQLNEQFLSVDNKLFITFLHLFTKPEAVINGYVGGIRKKYIDVLQYFAIALTILGIQAFLMLTFFKDAISTDNFLLFDVNKIQNNAFNPFSSIPNETFYNYQGLIYIITMPFSVMATWLSYTLVGSRQFNFTEHFVINIYYNAQLIMVSAILTIVFLWFGLNYMTIASISFIPLFGYLFYILKRVFNDSFLEALGKFFIVIIVYSIVVSVVFIVFFILYILF